MEVFRFQYNNNNIYRKYCDLLKCNTDSTQSITQIPFLPISFFKTQKIITTEFLPVNVFESSGTTGTHTSRHYIKDAGWYEQSFTKAFQLFYGDVDTYCIIGLLPSYLERTGSSLVHMTEALIRLSGNKNSGFYLYDHENLMEIIRSNEERKQKTLLIGVTYALLDFASYYPMPLHHVLVMETGGMKGRKKEITREEVHEQLQKQWSLQGIHSEYGMTELLSQAYAKEKGLFKTPPWMKVLLRAEDDPYEIISAEIILKQQTGPGNIIDLANLYSCSFIATDDIMRIHTDGKFEVLGRLDNANARGCGLMIDNIPPNPKP